MTTITQDEWDNEYARVTRIATQLRSSPGQQEQQDQITGLQQAIQRLESSLVSSSSIVSTLSPNEIQRRQRLLQGLRMNSTTNNSNSNNGDVLSSSNGSGQQQQQQQQQQSQSLIANAMKQQDDMIDELAIGVGRLKDQTQIINDEAKMHVTLLNDMEQNLDTAQYGLEGETRRAQSLKNDQSLWRLQLTVAALCILFILLMLMGLS